MIEMLKEMVLSCLTGKGKKNSFLPRKMDEITSGLPAWWLGQVMTVELCPFRTGSKVQPPRVTKLPLSPAAMVSSSMKAKQLSDSRSPRKKGDVSQYLKIPVCVFNMLSRQKLPRGEKKQLFFGKSRKGLPVQIKDAHGSEAVAGTVGDEKVARGHPLDASHLGAVKGQAGQSRQGQAGEDQNDGGGKVTHGVGRGDGIFVYISLLHLVDGADGGGKVALLLFC
jgi:hypothetical protein